MVSMSYLFRIIIETTFQFTAQSKPRSGLHCILIYMSKIKKTIIYLAAFVSTSSFFTRRR